jgi:hypothetical protein
MVSIPPERRSLLYKYQSKPCLGPPNIKYRQNQPLSTPFIPQSWGKFDIGGHPQTPAIKNSGLLQGILTKNLEQEWGRTLIWASQVAGYVNIYASLIQAGFPVCGIRVRSSRY